jgi:hypothetical protein
MTIDTLVPFNQACRNGRLERRASDDWQSRGVAAITLNLQMTAYGFGSASSK